MVGLPDGNHEISRLLFDEQGGIQTLEQYHWRIQYLEYQQVDVYRLPRKISLQNDKLSLRIVIDQWQIL